MQVSKLEHVFRPFHFNITQQLQKDFPGARIGSIHFPDVKWKLYQQFFVHFNHFSLYQCKVKYLIELARETGIKQASKTKEEKVERISEQMSRILEQVSTNPETKLMSFDLGRKNMAAVSCNIFGDQLFLKGKKFSILENQLIQPTSSLDFAFLLNNFLSSFPNHEYLYAIEQQMYQHNPTCTILESQLHAFLYPRTLSIPPRSVFRFLGLETFLKEKQKKKMTVEIVQSLIETKRISVDAELENLLFENEKKDDVADAVLNAMVSLVWIRKLLEEARDFLGYSSINQ